MAPTPVEGDWIQYLKTSWLYKLFLLLKNNNHTSSVASEAQPKKLIDVRQLVT